MTPFGLNWLCCIGVTEYKVDLEKQEVIVKGSIEYETILEKIKKTGKEVRQMFS